MLSFSGGATDVQGEDMGFPERCTESLAGHDCRFFTKSHGTAG
jgi:hypothetical protein